MRKCKFLMLLCLIVCSICSCNRTKTEYQTYYVTEDEIAMKLRDIEYDVKRAKCRLESVTYFDKDSRLYKQDVVDDAITEYVSILRVYSNALEKYLTILKSNVVDTAYFDNNSLIVITTYTMSSNDYEYLQSKYDKCQRELSKYDKK